jgi:hypothetical protein
MPSSSIAQSSMHEHQLRLESETGAVEGGFLAPFQHLQPGRAGCFSRGRNVVAPCEGASLRSVSWG